MPGNMDVSITYNAETRLLECTVTLDGFIPEAPEKVVTASEKNTVTLGAGRTISAVDSAHFSNTLLRTMSIANSELDRWKSAYATTDLADQMLAAKVDPALTYQETLATIVGTKPPGEVL